MRTIPSHRKAGLCLDGAANSAVAAVWYIAAILFASFLPIVTSRKLLPGLSRFPGLTHPSALRMTDPGTAGKLTKAARKEARQDHSRKR
jgi:hypothetical protein